MRAAANSMFRFKVLLPWTAAIAAAVLAVGLLHMPWARPLLRRVGGCPVPSLSAAQVETAQRRAWRSLRGVASAPALPALGFELRRTTLAEAQAWARARGISCEVRREGALLLCPQVPGSALSPPSTGAVDELAFGFRLSDLSLVNVTTLRTGLTGSDAEAQLRQIAAALERSMGAPARRIDGESAVLTYRYADYLADVSAMSLPGRGHALREHYMSALE